MQSINASISLFKEILFGVLLQRQTNGLLIEVAPWKRTKFNLNLLKYCFSVFVLCCVFDWFSMLQEWAQWVIIYFKRVGVAFIPEIWAWFTSEALLAVSFVAASRCTDLLHTFWWWKAQSNFLWPESWQTKCACIWASVCDGTYVYVRACEYVAVFIFIRRLS